MKKRVLNLVVAISLLVISFFSIIFLDTINGRVKVEKEKNTEVKEGEPSFNLPIVVIDTKGKRVNIEESIRGDIKIYNREEGDNYLSDTPELTSNLDIKIRGNSSSNFPKLSYSLELINKNGEAKNKRVLNMSKDSDWVLNGPFLDKSLIRNYMAYNISSKIMEYAPRVKFCEVFLIDDGKKTLDKNHYKGVYIMVEKIKVNKEKINIHETHKNADETSFIASKDREKKNKISISPYGIEEYIYDNSIIVRYPKKNITEGNKTYIKRTISEFERKLYSNDFIDKKNGYNKYIDVDSFVDYYVINEFFQNTDGGIYSTYFYKDYGEKIKAGPVWDFDIAMGNNWVSGELYSPKGFYMNSTSWFDRLLEDRHFVAKVIGRYKLLRETYLSDEYLLEFIDNAVKELGPSVDRNFAAWDIKYCNQGETFINNGYKFYNEDLKNEKESMDSFLEKNKKSLMDTTYMAKSYEEEITLLKRFIVNRGKWMDKNIEELYKWTK